MMKTIKAHYRRAKALAMLKDYWGAVGELKEALKMDKTDPNNFKHEMAQYEALAKQKDKKSDKKRRRYVLLASTTCVTRYSFPRLTRDSAI